MKKIPWKSICIGSIVMSVLVLARCVATIARELYYGRDQWMNLILRDPWTYVGMAAVAIVYISAIVCLVESKAPRKEAAPEAEE